MPDGETARVSRRHVIAATIGGALLGSAWGFALGEASTSDATPGVTVAWNRNGLAALFEHRDRRVLILDSDEPTKQRALVELITGFMRQRVDVIMAPDATLHAMPTGLMERWNVTEVLTTDPDTAHPQIGIAGRQLELGALTITSRRVVENAWHQGRPSTTGWYIDARHKAGRIVIAPSEPTLRHLAPVAGLGTAVVVGDADLEGIPAVLPAVTIVAPADAPLFNDAERLGNQAVRMFRDQPLTFQLTRSGVAMPSGG